MSIARPIPGYRRFIETCCARAATHAILTGKPFETLVDACRRQAAEEAATKIVQFGDWRMKLRPSASVTP
jgi:hypothetical protein